MPTAQANILITAKQTADAVFQQMFTNISAQMGAQATAVQKLNATYAQFSQWSRSQANAAAAAQQPNAALVQQYTNMANAAQKAGTQTNSLKINIVDIAAKLYLLQVGVRNAIGALEGLFKLGELGAKVYQAGESFDFLMAKMGVAPDIMNRLREASGGLATDYETQLRVMRLVAGQSDEVARAMANASPTLIEMARAAVKLDPSIKSVDFAMESLSTGIKRQSVRWIDNLNIIVRSGVANEAYAKTIGKNVAELTEEEKQMAYLNAVLEGHDKLMTQVGGDVRSATDRYGELRTNLKEVNEKFAVLLDKALIPTLDALNDMTDTVNRSKDMWDSIGVSLKIVGEILALDLKFWYAINQAMTYPARAISEWMDKTDNAKEKTGDWTGKISELETSLSSLQEELNSGSYAVDEYASRWDDAIDTFGEKYIKGQQKLLEGTTDISQKLIDEATDFQDRVTQIHDDAARRRIEIDTNFNQQSEDLNEKYYTNRADLEMKLHRLKQELGLEATPTTDAAKQLKKFQDALTQIEAGGNVPAGLSTILGLGGASTVERLKPVLIERIAQLQQIVTEEQNKARVKAIEDEIASLDARHNKEMDRLVANEAEKLAEVSASEERATQKANDESGKRIKKAIDDLQELKKSVKEDFEMAWINALDSVTAKGSELDRVLEGVRLKALGASQAQVDYLNSLNAGFSSPASLLMLVQGLSGINLGAKANEQVLQAYLNSIGRAGGGGVSANHPYLVGERGPEMFVPGVSGAIMPNGMGGGGTTVVIQAGAYLGGEADAARFGQMLVPILTRALQSTNNNIFATGSRRTSSRTG